jgi:hypothetical protein
MLKNALSRLSRAGAPAMRRAECSARAGLFVFVVLAGLVPASAQVGDDEREPVDVALVLAVDVSRSMSLGELAIQRRGYAEAITSPEVLRAIARGAHGRIAITIFEWAAEGSTRELVPWTLIEGAGDAAFVAARLSEQDSRGARRTSISGAILTGMALLETMPFQADRRVIDVSGDGPNNHGSPVTGARDAAVARGIAINGLPMMTSDGFGTIYSIPDLDEYYRRCVIGGPASFVLPVDGWDQFAEAVRRKLVLEIGGLVPKRRQNRWTAPSSGERGVVVPAQFSLSEPYDCLVGEKLWDQRRWQFDGTR